MGANLVTLFIRLAVVVHALAHFLGSTTEADTGLTCGATGVRVLIALVVGQEINTGHEIGEGRARRIGDVHEASEGCAIGGTVKGHDHKLGWRFTRLQFFDRKLWLRQVDRYNSPTGAGDLTDLRGGRARFIGVGFIRGPIGARLNGCG